MDRRSTQQQGQLGQHHLKSGIRAPQVQQYAQLSLSDSRAAWHVEARPVSQGQVASVFSIGIPVTANGVRTLPNAAANGNLNPAIVSQSSNSTSSSVAVAAHARTNIPPTAPQRSVSHPQMQTQVLPIKATPAASAQHAQPQLKQNYATSNAIPIPTQNAVSTASSWQHDESHVHIQYANATCGSVPQATDTNFRLAASSGGLATTNAVTPGRMQIAITSQPNANFHCATVSAGVTSPKTGAVPRRHCTLKSDALATGADFGTGQPQLTPVRQSQRQTHARSAAYGAQTNVVLAAQLALGLVATQPQPDTNNTHRSTTQQGEPEGLSSRVNLVTLRSPHGTVNGTPSAKRNSVNGTATNATSVNLVAMALEQASNVSASTWSLGSCASGTTTSSIRKLRSELLTAQEKVASLTKQLSSNASMVSAFEKNLEVMSARLQSLSASAAAKDDEVSRLRSTLDELTVALHAAKDVQAQSGEVDRGATRASKSKQIGWLKDSFGRAFALRRASSRTGANSRSSSYNRESVCSSDCERAETVVGTGISECEDVTSRRCAHTSVSSLDDALDEATPLSADALRRLVQEKDSRLADLQLESLAATQQLAHYHDVINKLRSELTSLKSENDRLYQQTSSAQGDGYDLSRTRAVPSSNTLAASMAIEASRVEEQTVDTFAEFNHLLGLSSAAESSGESIADCKKRIVLRVAVSLLPSANVGTGDSSLNNFATPSQSTQGSPTSVFESFSKGTLRTVLTASNKEVFIGILSVDRDLRWIDVKLRLKALFKTYLSLVDPVASIGLAADSLHCFSVDDSVYSFNNSEPDVDNSPVGQQLQVATNCTLTLHSYAQGGAVDLLAFESLIPRTILERYISLLLEHRRVILCGSADTGKSGLALRLAEYVIRRSGRNVTAQSLVAFQLDSKSVKEVRAYLGQLASACETQQQAAEEANTTQSQRNGVAEKQANTAGDLPTVIVLDNMHNVPNLVDLLGTVLAMKHHRSSPYIIGTMNQRGGSPSSLQLHHNFRWILCANHMEPIKGLLSRTLRSRLIDSAVRKCDVSRRDCSAIGEPQLPGAFNADECERLVRITSWVVTMWQFVNRLIESYSSVDVTLGPRLFLSCPTDVVSSQQWFTNLWNYSLVPYVLEAIRQGLHTFGRRHTAPSWTDPVDFVRQTYPWQSITSTSASESKTTCDGSAADLLGIRPEDIGFFDSSKVQSGAAKAASASATDSPHESDIGLEANGVNGSRTCHGEPSCTSNCSSGASGSANAADAVAQLLERMQSRVSSLGLAEQLANNRHNSHLMTLSSMNQSGATRCVSQVKAQVSHMQPRPSESESESESMSFNAILAHVRADTLTASSTDSGQQLDKYFSNLLKR